MRCPRCDRNLVSGDRFCSRCGLARSEDGKPVDPLLGITLAERYRIEERIGVGGMGTVYRGTHVTLGQSVAIKVLHERYTGDEKLTKRFEKEALTYGEVTHPNLVGLHDFGRTDDGTVYMVLEYCPGISLARLIREQGRLDPMLATDVILQIAQGLGAAHQKGIIHRDLKPENIVLTETRPGRYHARLLDFGIAKRLDDDEPRLTQAGMVFGTPEYMAPEQARGKNVDKRSDIYALGTMFYELLVGDPPFTGSDKLRIMQQQANQTPEPPSKVLPGLNISAPLEALVMRCIAKQQDVRYQSTDCLIEALDSVATSGRLTPEPFGAFRDDRSESRAGGSREKATSPLDSIILRASGDHLESQSRPTEAMASRPVKGFPIIAAFAGALCLVIGIPLYYAMGDEPQEQRAVHLPEPSPDTSKPSQEPHRRSAAVLRKSASVDQDLKRSQSAVNSATLKENGSKVDSETERLTAAKVEEERQREISRRKAREAKERKAFDQRLARLRGMLKKGQFKRVASISKRQLRKRPKHKELSAILAQANRGMSIAKEAKAALADGRCAQVFSRLKEVKTFAPADRLNNERIARCELGMPPKHL